MVGETARRGAARRIGSSYIGLGLLFINNQPVNRRVASSPRPSFPRPTYPFVRAWPTYLYPFSIPIINEYLPVHYPYYVVRLMRIYNGDEAVFPFDFDNTQPHPHPHPTATRRRRLRGRRAETASHLLTDRLAQTRQPNTRSPLVSQRVGLPGRSPPCRPIARISPSL